MFSVFFFFKQKTAYEIKECDWSSDVCSSDLFLAEQDFCGFAGFVSCLEGGKFCDCIDFFLEVVAPFGVVLCFEVSEFCNVLAVAAECDAEDCIEF